jgi:site-specific DNA-methyltransferase (adenine-specific)
MATSSSLSTTSIKALRPSCFGGWAILGASSNWQDGLATMNAGSNPAAPTSSFSPDIMSSQFHNTIIQGEALAVLRSLPSGLADAIITDPPYSSGGAFRGDRMSNTNTKYTQGDVVNIRPDFAGDNRDQRAFNYWCALWLSECLRVAKPGAPIVLFTDWRQLPTVTDAMQAGGWVWRGLAVWDKTEGARPTLGRFTNQCEYMVWGSAGEMALERLDEASRRTLPGVFRCPVRQADKHHVTGKPTALMQQVVKICKPGGLILDPFAGSGTTLVAAKKEGYQWLGCELLQYYVEVCEQRLGASVKEGMFGQAMISEPGGLAA